MGDMDDNTHRRIISRNTPNQPHNQQYNPQYGQQYNPQYGQHYCSNVSGSSEPFTENRKKNINLKQIKSITTHCAKSLTNKLITLSNSLTHSSSNYYSTQPNPYAVSNPHYNTHNTRSGHYSTSHGTPQGGQYVGQGQRGEQSSPAAPVTGGIQYIYTDLRPSSQYGINNIINRITTTDDIRTHRELVIIIEYCLSFKDFLIEINIEKDRFGAPTMESINNFSIINATVRDKIMTYIRNRKDCCIFVIKFITWKMRCTKKPEEIILSLELLFSCLNEFGGYFLVLFTKSLMKTLRKLLFVTNFKSSITSNVKKKITKILVGKSNYIHPGISTDIRIHIFKSKILYNIQLYYELYLFEQDQYVVFYDGYKDMRLRGIKFPTINDQDKQLLRPSLPSHTHTESVGDCVGNVIGLEELDELLYNINNNNYTLEYINSVRNKLITSINILSNKPSLNNYQTQLLDKILKLNDSLLLLTTTSPVSANTEDTVCHPDSVNPVDPFTTMTPMGKEGEGEGANNIRGEGERDVEVDLDEIFNFINFNEKNEQLIDEDDEEDEEELINNFINLPSSPISRNTNTVNTVNTVHSVNTVDNVDTVDTVEKVDEGDKVVRVESTEDSVEKVENQPEVRVREKNISELVSELDNLEMDFGHMSMNNF